MLIVRRWAFRLVIVAMPILIAACGGGATGTPSGRSTREALGSTRASVRTADAALMKILEQHGAHLAKPRSTRLYLDFPSQKNARAAAGDVPQMYSVAALGKTGSNGHYALRLTTTMVITLDAIGRREAALTTIAQRHHGMLDGWDAALTP
jgi:DNA transposition AAA+ family ATPase